MANLITEKQKKIVKMDYLIRLSSVSLIILSILGLFLLAYVIPYYISLSKKDQAVAEQFKNVINIENKENVGESASKIANQTSDEMKAVEFYNKNNFIPSVYFNKIIQNKNSSIIITKLSFTLVRKGQGQFLVSGLAKNREGLVTFIDDLKAKADFPNVESPVSDFAIDKDIPFTLNMSVTI